MPVKAFSDDFAREYQKVINASPTYRQAGKGWKWTVGLVVEAEPDKNVPETRGLLLDLFDGEAREVRNVSADEARGAEFVITAPYTQWKKVMKGELDPTRGMMSGKLKLKGDLPTIVRYTKASQELAQLTGKVDVEYPDEVPA